MTFGLTSAGISLPRQADLQADLEASWQSTFGANVRLDPESPDGQIIQLVTDRLAALYELGGDLYSSIAPSSAGGIHLDRLFGLLGIPRLPAAPSTLVETLSGTPGTMVPAGSLVRIHLGSTFTTLVDATIGSGGTIDVACACTATGPIPALAGQVTEIGTPVSGWTGCTNALDAVRGRDLETDAAYRFRVAGMRRGLAGSSAPALLAAIQRVAGVDAALVVVNRSSSPDADGRPGHSIEAVVHGGDDAAIRAALWGAAPAGIQIVGSSPGFVLDAIGETQDVPFSRPTDVDLWAIVEYRPDRGFPSDGEAQMQAEILAAGAALGLGDQVVPWRLEQAVTAPRLLRLAIRVGLTAPGASADPYPIRPTELARLDSTRITFAVV